VKKGTRGHGKGQEEMASSCAKGGLGWILGKTSLQRRQEEPGQERCEIWGRKEELGQQKLTILKR